MFDMNTKIENASKKDLTERKNLEHLEMLINKQRRLLLDFSDELL